MIKTGALNTQSPSSVSGQRGTVIKNGEAVLLKEEAPQYTETNIALSLNKDRVKDTDKDCKSNHSK